jgi:hypothetical protein
LTKPIISVIIIVIEGIMRIIRKQGIVVELTLAILIFCSGAVLGLGTPGTPTGIEIRYEYRDNGSYKATILWNPVVEYIDGSALGDDLEGYFIFRGFSGGTGWETIGFVKVGEDTSYVQEFDSAGFLVNPYFYRVYAVSKGWNEYFDSRWSKGSMIADTSIDRNIIAVDSTDRVAVFMPKGVNGVLYKENNQYGEDLEIVISPYENDVCEVRVLKARSREDITRDFSFSEPLVQIRIDTGYKTIGNHSNAAVNTPANKVPILYWSNGVEWVRVGGEIKYSSTGEVVEAKMSKLGQFKVAQEENNDNIFNITSIYPKIFTPGGVSPYDKVQFIFEKKWENIVSGKVFDLAGAHIGNLSQGVTENSLSWDGKTVDGRDALSGIYIYQLQVPDGQKITGTVVLAN